MLDLTHLPAYLTDPMSLVLIALLGGVIGLLSGLLGIGGGLLIMPALVLLPPLLFGKPWLSLQLASGVAALQGLASSTAGTWVHYRSKRLNKAWVLALGLPAIAGGIVGAIVAQYWSKQLMLGVLAAVLAFTLFQTVKTFAKLYLLPKPTEAVEEPPLKEWTHLSGKAQAGMMLASLLIGVLAGVIGLGGAMFYIPILSDGLRLPYKQALATSAGVVWLTSFGTVAGKMSQGAIPWELALTVSLLTFVFGWWGAKLQHRTPTRVLRLFHITLLGLALFETLRQLI